MGLFGFGKKKKEDIVKDTKVNEVNISPETVPEEPVSKSEPSACTYSVVDTFKLRESKDIVVVGRVTEGTLHVGDAVYVTNPGDADSATTLTTVISLERPTGPNTYEQLKEATAVNVAVKLENMADAGLKPGSVVYTRTATVAQVHSAYINAIGDAYVQGKKADLTEEDIERMSISDLAETWRLLNFVMSRRNDIPEEVHNDNRRKVGVIARAIIDKLFKEDHIYAIFNKNTGEPHLYSRTIKREKDYQCSPPDIMIITENYKAAFEQNLAGSACELRRIDNGPEKKGIHEFLGMCFYLNGAQGVDILSQEVGIASEMLVAPPDFSGVRDVEIPVTNPDIERWLLLMGQMGEPASDDEKLIYSLYARLLDQAITKGKFLIPMKLQGEVDEKPEDGTVTIKKNSSFQIATQSGKGERAAVRMYTDWKRLKMAYDDEWKGMVETIDGMIETFDIALNATKYTFAGCYYSKEMYEQAKAREGR